MSDSKTQLQRRSTGRSVLVTPELPEPPKEFLQDPVLAGAWRRWMDQLNEWRKNIRPSSNTGAFTTSIRGSLVLTGTGQSTGANSSAVDETTQQPSVQPPPVVFPPSGPPMPPPVQEDQTIHKSLLKLIWMGI